MIEQLLGILRKHLSSSRGFGMKIALYHLAIHGFGLEQGLGRFAQGNSLGTVPGFSPHFGKFVTSASIARSIALKMII